MFPTIKHIDDVLPSLRDRNDFVVAKRLGYTAIDYVFADKDTFDDPIRRECRGLKFGSDGSLIARPYHKFFNVGERDDTQPNAVDWGRPHVVLEKLDGSMVHPASVNGVCVLMTRMGRTEVAMQAESHLTEAYRALIDEAWSDGWTPIFEWCSPNNRIVVRYEEDALVLTGMRRLSDGVYAGHATLQRIGADYGIPVVKAWGTDVGDLTAFLHHARSLENAEGCVVRFDGGDMLKIKADAYVRMHKAKDAITLEKNVLALVLRGEEDDVLPILPEEEAHALTDYAAKVRHNLAEAADQLRDTICDAKQRYGEDRKAFALKVVPTLPKIMSGPAFKAFSGGNAYEAVCDIVSKNLGSSTDVEKIRPLIGDVRW
jgi:RNA ligase